MYHIKFVFYVFVVFLCFASCSTSKQFHVADRYFEGLDALKAENATVAIRAFTQSRKQDSQTASILATEELLPLLYEAKDYSGILDITDIPSLDNDEDRVAQSQLKLPVVFDVDQNLISRYRLLAMIHTDNPRTADYITDWATAYPFSQEHRRFFESDDFIAFAEQMLHQQDGFSAQTLDIIKFRIALYKRDYAVAVNWLEKLWQNDGIETGSSIIFENQTALMLSDIGKALLYGSTSRVHYAQLLEQAAGYYPDESDEAFMCHFYAARLYGDSADPYRNRSLQQFKAAMDGTTRAERYDNALWYYLTTVNNTSSRSAISVLQEFAPQWHDPLYFGDFLEDLAHSLLSAENWKGFYALYEFLIPYMSAVSLSQYAYISGRLIEEGFLADEFSIDEGYGNEERAKKAAEKAQREAFEMAFDAVEGSLYYRIMAAERLDISSEKVLDALFQREKKPSATYDEGLEYILTEYIHRGYTQKVYPLYIEYSTAINLEVAMQLSSLLVGANNPSVENNFEDNFYPDSLRIAARALRQSGETVLKEQIELLYPRFYSEYVVLMPKIYELSEYLLYALIRSESHFDHDVQSWAGAVGLMQLMSGTAGDVARKLKIEDYNLHNAQTNIQLGSFYLNELIPRVDGSVLRALFSYNAGITNVRRWVEKYSELSLIPDLFLEILPYEETRGYGRKMLSAAAMYGMLYYDTTVDEIVVEIMQ